MHSDNRFWSPWAGKTTDLNKNVRVYYTALNGLCFARWLPINYPEPARNLGGLSAVFCFDFQRRKLIGGPEETWIAGIC